MSALGACFGETATEFDRAVLEARGISPAIAEHFRGAARFPAGPSRVSVSVNGVPSGQVLATFDQEGQLCLDAELLDQARLIVLPDLSRRADSRHCLPVAEGLPGSTVELDPGQQQVRLRVPTDRLLGSAAVQRNWATGGRAGLLNYDALVMNSTAFGQSSQYRGLGTELGFNAGDWVVRSRQNYTSFQGVERFETLYTQASRTWEAYGANVQLGQLNLQSSLFAGEPFLGVQLVPETALVQPDDQGSGGEPQVQGLAYSSARVEVRQSGVVIHTVLVPPGPFTLRDLPLLSHRLDLEVSVFEEGGEQREFRVPAANLRPVSLGAPLGYGLAAGKVRRLAGDERDAPSFFALGKDWQWTAATRANTGLMGAGGYQSLGLGIEQALARNTRLSVQQLSSRTEHAGQGSERQAMLSTVLGPAVFVSLTAGQRSQGFRHLADLDLESMSDDLIRRAERQWGASLSHADAQWGSSTATFTRYATKAGQARTRLGLSWSRRFSDATLGLSVQHDSQEDARGTGVYASLSLPLGRNRSLSVYGRHDGSRGLRTGGRYTEQISETLGYSLSADRLDDGQTDVHGRLSALPRYTSLDVGYSRRGDGASSHDLTLRGGLAVHEAGVTPSPYPLRDTFGLLKAGDGAGIKISTPPGPVWTDAGGRAVAASLPAYQTSRIELDTVSLPRNVDVLNGYQQVEAGRGAVPRFDFSVGVVRRLMLMVRTAAGEPVPKGVLVYDQHNAYLTTVVDAGLVYLADAPSVVRLQVMLADRPCHLELDTTALGETHTAYDTVEVVCQVA
ncbi:MULTISPECIES: fimbria/pilus outer membrane usher protein [unclassified Pseudomonas]|uniref:fimbria/pilus outer membrane usher protein n=1 Tax=unclassified Pseudomonas TaxID=196821 RepID=UPI00211478F1|nr:MULTISPECIES: fimbria/pilus outer membrane usher protein [unclassified Pseudomonas]